jgi:hypothetical protein
LADLGGEFTDRGIDGGIEVGLAEDVFGNLELVDGRGATENFACGEVEELPDLTGRLELATGKEFFQLLFIGCCGFSHLQLFRNDVSYVTPLAEVSASSYHRFRPKLRKEVLQCWHET